MIGKRDKVENPALSVDDSNPMEFNWGLAADRLSSIEIAYVVVWPIVFLLESCHI